MSKKAYEIDCFWKLFVAFCRIWAISTAFGLWGVGVEALYYHHMLGIYLIVTAAIMSFLESVFLLNYFIIACTDETSSLCLRVWDVVLWLDNYKKGLLYLALAAACFVQPHTLWMALICGGMLVVSGILYTLKSIRSRSEQRQRAASQKPSYDRFDEVPEEEIEDSIINAAESGTAMPTVGDQAEILTV